MISSWLRNRRRRALLREPFPDAWQDLLRTQVRHTQYLTEAQCQRLQSFVQVMAAEKDWVGIDDLVISDEIRVVVGGNAGLLTLGFPQPYYFDRLDTIIVHPHEFVPRRSKLDLPSGSLQFDQLHLGEAWHRGPIVLSWQVIQHADQAPGSNLVIHEFAHHIDGLAGEVDGVPPLLNRRQERDWQAVTTREYERLVRQTRHGEPSLLDEYGATNPAEFFAVASECFFERPCAMRQRHRALYQLLAELYQQDLAAWLPDAEAR